MSREALLKIPDYSDRGQLKFDWDPRKEGVPNWYIPMVRYNCLIHPIAPFALKGFVWYQGETNAMWDKAARYRQLLPLMIADWRRLWGTEPIPFIAVQLPNTYGAHNPKNSFKKDKWSELREAQMAVLQVPKAALAVTIDAGDGDLHPKTKEAISQCIALAARNVAYGEAIEYLGPIYREMKVEGRAIRLFFDHARGGLISKDGEPLRFFQVAGEDKRFVPAEAKIENDSIVVFSALVENPVAVRYARASNPLGVNFYNRDGLLGSPFRTDHWEDAGK
jgi:sialate O-acetylesterase